MQPWNTPTCVLSEKKVPNLVKKVTIRFILNLNPNLNLNLNFNL